MTKVNSVLVLPLCRDGMGAQPLPGMKERVYEAVIEEKTKDYIFLRICKDCCDELGLLPDREIQVSGHSPVQEMLFISLANAMIATITLIILAPT